jgi:hypothetical protein
VRYITSPSRSNNTTSQEYASLRILSRASDDVETPRGSLLGSAAAEGNIARKRNKDRKRERERENYVIVSRSTLPAVDWSSLLVHSTRARANTYLCYFLRAFTHAIGRQSDKQLFLLVPMIGFVAASRGALRSACVKCASRCRLIYVGPGCFCVSKTSVAFFRSLHFFGAQRLILHVVPHVCTYLISRPDREDGGPWSST